MFRHLLTVSCLIALSTAPVAAPAFAQEEKPAAEKAQDAPKLPPVNWAEVESTGTMSSVKGGALEKTLWQGQKRSDIEKLIQTLPAQGGLHSVVNLQRRLLLSKTNAGTIVNDIGPMRGNDLLIQRINKLIQMGLYDDAWELYTQKAEEPYDVSISEIGMLLMVMRGDMATACLEEKVFSSRHPDNKFFKTLDAACARTMGISNGGGAGAFDGSAVLSGVYGSAPYSVAASTPDVLARMSPLERALVLANGKIRYDGLSREVVARTPSSLIALYLMDKNLPEAGQAMIREELHERGTGWHIVTLARQASYKKAKDLGKDIENQWPVLESALTWHTSPGDRAMYVPLLEAAKPAKLSTETLTRVLGAFLAAQKELPAFWLDAAQKRAPEKPIIYIYLQAFRALTPTAETKTDSAVLLRALKSLKPADAEQILAIFETLDKDAAAGNTLLAIYEKHSVLTLEGNYVMPSLGLNMLLETAPEKKQIGITVLAVLNALAAKPDNMYSGTVRKALYSLLNVGLIEDAKQIGAETVASVLNKY